MKQKCKDIYFPPHHARATPDNIDDHARFQKEQHLYLHISAIGTGSKVFVDWVYFESGIDSFGDSIEPSASHTFSRTRSRRTWPPPERILLDIRFSAISSLQLLIDNLPSIAYLYANVYLRIRPKNKEISSSTASSRGPHITAQRNTYLLRVCLLWHRENTMSSMTGRTR